RINGILKTEFQLSRIFKSRPEALLAVKSAVEAYNNVRPHMSCSNLTPAYAHQSTEPLMKHWKNRRKKAPSPAQ
ncbi:integrase core domain-containing protein, partial [Mucilaginibacter sp. NFR10]